MNKFKIITVVFLLISLFVKGQENNSVKVFEGRGLFNNSKVILDLSYQNLKTVPIEATNPLIETLILDNNNIEVLPSWIGNLKNLKVLSIRNNNLNEVGNSLSLCENLEQLYLSGNRSLSDISSLGSCEKLKIIDVVDTNINDIPGSIRMMDNLFYFKYTSK